MEFKELNLTPLAPLEVADINDVFIPENVCAKQINYAVEDGKLSHVDFVGGCDGNLKALSTLLEGMPVDEVITRLGGITCGKKDTSCVDQLSKALLERQG